MEEEKSLNQEVPLETIYRYTLQENARLKAENEQLESKIKKLENSITSFKKWQRKVVERNYEFWIHNAKEIIGEGVDRQECRELPRFFTAYSRFEQSEEVQREELIRKIEASVKSMSIRELEALYYELSTKNYISERL